MEFVNYVIWYNEQLESELDLADLSSIGKRARVLQTKDNMENAALENLWKDF